MPIRKILAVLFLLTALVVSLSQSGNADVILDDFTGTSGVVVSSGSFGGGVLEDRGPKTFTSASAYGGVTTDITLALLSVTPDNPASTFGPNMLYNESGTAGSIQWNNGSGNKSIAELKYEFSTPLDAIDGTNGGSYFNITVIDEDNNNFILKTIVEAGGETVSETWTIDLSQAGQSLDFGLLGVDLTQINSISFRFQSVDPAVDAQFSDFFFVAAPVYPLAPNPEPTSLALVSLFAIMSCVGRRRRRKPRRRQDRMRDSKSLR